MRTPCASAATSRIISSTSAPEVLISPPTAGTGAGMNRMRVTANSRDAAIRAQWKRAQEHLIMANTAAEEHAAELEQGPEAAIGDDPLAKVEAETHGTDADAGEYLQQSDETLEAPEAPEATEDESASEEE